MALSWPWHRHHHHHSDIDHVKVRTEAEESIARTRALREAVAAQWDETRLMRAITQPRLEDNGFIESLATGFQSAIQPKEPPKP